MYTPKYHFVFKKSPLYEDTVFSNELKDNNRKRWFKFNLKKHKHPPKKKKQEEIIKVHSEESIPRKDWKRGIRFSRQGERSSILNQAQPHEKRFEYFDLPGIYSKVKRLPNYDFDKLSK